MTKVKNPIIPGFNPDPSICQVGDDYYIATSTFEWFPGVEIWHSKNLIDWNLVDRPLNRYSQLQLQGVKASGGLQAPNLSYRNGKFYLLYTVVYEPSFNCFMVETDQIGTPWSDPVYINSSGIDQSFFHDQDNKSYVVNNLVTNERGQDNFLGIILQEFDWEKRQLVGPVHNVYQGKFGFTEGPHIFKRNGYYYLLSAEGGTGYNHCVVLSRSKSLLGPYIRGPKNPILTAADDPNNLLQKAGHASITKEDKDGNVWLVALTSRPMGWKEACPLGRETSLFRYFWNKDGWLENYYGSNHPNLFVDVPFDGQQNLLEEVFLDFSKLKKMPLPLMTPRGPIDNSWLNFTKDGLQLTARNNYRSLYNQSSLFKSWSSTNFEAEIAFSFKVSTFLQDAGMILRYNEANQYALILSKNVQNETILKLEVWISDHLYLPLKPIILKDEFATIAMKAEVKGYKINFYYAIDGTNWIRIEKDLDTLFLSEDSIYNSFTYTGATVGFYASDNHTRSEIATFKYFKYKDLSDNN